MIDRDLLPAFKDAPLPEISQADMATVVIKMHKQAPVLANRTFEVTRKMFNWAIEQGLVGIAVLSSQGAGAETKARSRVK